MWAGVVGGLVLVATAYALRYRIVEQYLLWKLEHGDEERKQAAATRLAELGSFRAIRLLVEEHWKPHNAHSLPDQAMSSRSLPSWWWVRGCVAVRAEPERMEVSLGQRNAWVGALSRLVTTSGEASVETRDRLFEELAAHKERVTYLRIGGRLLEVSGKMLSISHAETLGLRVGDELGAARPRHPSSSGSPSVLGRVRVVRLEGGVATCEASWEILSDARFYPKEVYLVYPLQEVNQAPPDVEDWQGLPLPWPRAGERATAFPRS